MTAQVSERGVELPCLIRSREAPDRALTSEAQAENIMLLTTKALEDAVIAYLQSGEMTDLIDVNELTTRIAELRGVSRTSFDVMRQHALVWRGPFETLVQHPLALDGESS